MEVAFFEPWYGGSHRAFLDAWCGRSRHSITVYGLAARHWKWRQEASAWELSRRVVDMSPPDLIACSDFVDLPRLMGFLPASWASVPTFVYFHENQLTYRRTSEETNPGGLPEDFTHGFSNILTAVRAETLVFNSEFHRADFQRAADELLQRLPRPNPRSVFAERMARALVIPPLPELAKVPLGPGPPAGAPLRVVFPHRLEFDKDPCGFLRAVKEASSRCEIEVVLLGGELQQAAASIVDAAAAIAPLIVSSGRFERRDDYLAQLGSADIVASTAQHEFFGVAFAEAMAAGCTPLAPDRLNYPSLVAGTPKPAAALYGSPDDFVKQLLAHAQPARLEELRAQEHRKAIADSIGPFDAAKGALALDDAITQSCPSPREPHP